MLHLVSVGYISNEQLPRSEKICTVYKIEAQTNESFMIELEHPKIWERFNFPTFSILLSLKSLLITITQSCKMIW